MFCLTFEPITVHFVVMNKNLGMCVSFKLTYNANENVCASLNSIDWAFNIIVVLSLIYKLNLCEMCITQMQIHCNYSKVEYTRDHAKHICKWSHCFDASNKLHCMKQYLHIKMTRLLLFHSSVWKMFLINRHQNVNLHFSCLSAILFYVDWKLLIYSLPFTARFFNALMSDDKKNHQFYPNISSIL